MGVRIHRVIVRGRFQGLDDATRAVLQDEADEHDYLHAAFTRDGTLVYDAAIDFFSLRYELRTDDEVDGRGPGDVAVLAEALATADLAERGLGYGPLRITSTDMADMWSGRR